MDAGRVTVEQVLDLVGELDQRGEIRERMQGVRAAPLPADRDQLFAVDGVVDGAANLRVRKRFLLVVETQGDWPVVEVSVRQFPARPGSHLGVAFEHGADIGGAQIQAGVQGVGDEVLDPFGFVHVGQIDHPLHPGQPLEADPRGPPAVAQIPDALLGHGQGQLVRTADHGQALFRREIGEGPRILPLPYVPGHDGHAAAEVVGEIGEQEARVRRSQLDPRGQAVDSDRPVDPALHIGGEGEVRGIGFQHVDGEDQVVGGPGGSVAPLDAGTDLYGEFGVVFAVLVPGGDPGNQFVFERVVEVEGFVEEIVADARGGPRQVRIEGVVILDLSDAGAALGTVHDQRALAGHLFQAGRCRLLFGGTAAGEQAQGGEQAGDGEQEAGHGGAPGIRGGGW